MFLFSIGFKKLVAICFDNKARGIRRFFVSRFENWAISLVNRIVKKIVFFETKFLLAHPKWY